LGAPGYEVAADDLTKFAATLFQDGNRYSGVRDKVPAFGGWEYVPFVGVPIVGLAFVGRYNETSQLMKDALGALGSALDNAGDRLKTVAANDLITEQNNTAKLPTHP
jgi:hypothetical protein